MGVADGSREGRRVNYLSLCSGIEAATCAWHPLGWKPVAFSEIERFPSAVLAHHYPSVPNWGDMTRYQEWPDANVDVLVGGTPCQSFSVAGLRKGLDDPRGNLMLTYGAIAAKYRPTWLVWENVPGVLSSNGGRDFGTFLGMLGQLGYGFAYRVLDAQYAGLAQRRKRVFVVGCLGDWRRAAAVLFERHGLSGHPAPRRKARETAPTIPSRSTGGGGLGTDFDCDGGLIHAPAVSPALKARDCKGPSSDGDGDGAPLIAHTLRGEGFDASEDGTGRGTPLVSVQVAPTLRAGGNSTGGDRPYGTDVDTCDSLIAFDTTQVTSAANRSSPKAGDPCHPLAAGAHAPAIAFGWQNSSQQGASVSNHCAPTLDKSKTPAVAFDLRGREGGAQFEGPNETANIRAASGGSSRSYVATNAVRRLTPVECERLQGFSDGYTAIPWRGKTADQCPDGPRYKALGNSMAVPCMRWLGERIAAVEAVSRQRAAA